MARGRADVWLRSLAGHAVCYFGAPCLGEEKQG